MLLAIKIILSITGLLLIFLIQLQSGKADGISSAIVGGNRELNLFSSTKTRGTDLVLQRMTIVLTAAFFALLVTAYWVGNS